MPRRLAIRPRPRSDLVPARILDWADTFKARVGRWPTRDDGAVCIPESNWSAVDQCLKLGLRGLTRGSSLAKLLKEHRGRRHKGLLPRLTIAQILAWADAHHSRTGDWPDQTSGAVTDAPGETWGGVNAALDVGGRGLPGGSSLAQMLEAHRGVRNPMALPRLTEEQILAWADAHHARTGEWPSRGSGPIAGSPGEAWSAVNDALQAGCRGLPGGTTLARLLAEHRGVRHHLEPPTLQVREILVWADAHLERTGQWPTAKSGEVVGVPGETWCAVDTALHDGTRGLRGGDSLARLLERRRERRNPASLPHFSTGQILRWADAHHARTGAWPGKESGPILHAPWETWNAVDRALRTGRRGLPGGSSLAQLLAAERGVRNPADAPRLTLKQILGWADEHRSRTGRWPSVRTEEPIPGAPGETWSAIDAALKAGYRGLRGGSSLARLLAERRKARNPLTVPALTEARVLAWADAHHRRTGEWPKVKSGPIEGAPGETWSAVNAALAEGLRSLPGGDTLTRLLARRRGKRNGAALPPLTVEQIRTWVLAHHRRTGEWPQRDSGSILDAPGETWLGVYQALYAGLRGLPGGTSLPRIVRECQDAMNPQRPTGAADRARA